MKGGTGSGQVIRGVEEGKEEVGREELERGGRTVIEGRKKKGRIS